MIRLVILLTVLGIGLLLWYKLKNTPADKQKKLKFQIFAGAVIALMLFLAVTGRLNFIYAAIASFIAFLPRLAPLLKYLPLVNRFRQAANQNNQQQSSQQASNTNNMGKDKAYDVLGLKPGASKDEIIAAHKKMMQKVHPDRGGSDYLAAEINTAKDTLLS